MNKKSLFLMLTLFILITAAGCAPECSQSEYSVISADLVYPPDGSVLSYQSHPSFDWELVGGCLPEYYHVEIIRGDGHTSGTDTLGDTSQASTGMNLIPGMRYDWKVVPFGTFGNEGLEKVYGNESQTFTFYADGRCSADELVPPVLKKPADGIWIGADEYKSFPRRLNLKWSYPGNCFPEYFKYELASDPDFDNIITAGLTNWNRDEVWVQVPECARIYWRVEARTGNDSGGYSEPWRFTYAMDYNCWQNQASIDAALIRGFVFQDTCDTTVPYVPDGVEIFPPCTFGEPYGVHGDGNRQRGENGEPALEGIIVDLGAGPCPSVGMDQYITEENGMFYFMVQSPGEYCISVDKAKNQQLMEGIWTSPLSLDMVAGQTIVFETGEMEEFFNFGWDPYDYEIIHFEVKLTSFCRSGDSTNYPSPVIVEKGSEIPIFARNEEATWFATIVDGIRCYISIESGEPKEDPEGLQIYPKLPPPVVEEEEKEERKPSRQTKQCSDYNNRDACLSNGCAWADFAGGGVCGDP